MSAPETNIKTQKKRHRGPLIGMAIVVVFGVMLIVYWLFEETATSDGPQGAGSQIESPIPPTPETEPGIPTGPLPTNAPDAGGSTPDAPRTGVITTTP